MEIPLKRKYRVGFKSRHKSTTSNGGNNRHRGETDSRRREFADNQRKLHQRVMVLLPSGKRRFVLASDLVYTS